MNRRSFLRCLPGAPAAIAATPLAALQMDQSDESSEGDREVLENCEHCERSLYEGDLVHACWDGPTFCESCAPTWLDLKAEQDDLIARGEFADHFEDGEDAAHRARDCVMSQIALGNGAKKHVWRL